MPIYSIEEQTNEYDEEDFIVRCDCAEKGIFCTQYQFNIAKDNFYNGFFVTFIPNSSKMGLFKRIKIAISILFGGKISSEEIVLSKNTLKCLIEKLGSVVEYMNEKEDKNGKI